MIEFITGEKKEMTEYVLEIPFCRICNSAGKTVYVITVATPAYNGNEVESSVFSKNFEFVQEIKQQSSPINGGTTSIYIYKNPENPVNTKVAKHLHLWNKEDKVAGGFAGDDYYKANGITENIEIPTEGEYSESIISLSFTGGIKFGSFIEFKNAHGFDANRPQLIYEMLSNGNIKKIE